MNKKVVEYGKKVLVNWQRQLRLKMLIQLVLFWDISQIFRILVKKLGKTKPRK